MCIKIQFFLRTKSRSKCDIPLATKKINEPYIEYESGKPSPLPKVSLKQGQITGKKYSSKKKRLAGKLIDAMDAAAVVGGAVAAV